MGPLDSIRLFPLPATSNASVLNREESDAHTAEDSLSRRRGMMSSFAPGVPLATVAKRWKPRPLRGIPPITPEQAHAPKCPDRPEVPRIGARPGSRAIGGLRSGERQ